MTKGHLGIGDIRPYTSSMVAHPYVKEFEICLHKADDSISMKMTVNAIAPYDAKLQAASMRNEDLVYAVIWLDLSEVATVHRDKPN
jgi:hypothetical protein